MSYYGNQKIANIIDQKMKEFCKSLIGNRIYLRGTGFVCKTADYVPITRCFSLTDENDKKYIICEHDSFAVETLEKDVFFQ